MAWYYIALIILLVLLFLSVILYRQFFKRFWDIILSGIAIIILSPTFLALTILGRIKMKGNPFFVQPRPGKKGNDGKEKIFNLIKFRSMTEEKDKNGNYLPDDVRLTKYGRILRSTSLDELPEFFNILKGDMSIVGPRPLLPRDVVCMNEVQHQRHNVRPGLTGLSQCAGRNSLDWDVKLATDVEYVNSVSFILDCKIIIRTALKVIKREDVEFDEGLDMDLKDWNELKNKETSE